jgi:hypothetical protein
MILPPRIARKPWPRSTKRTNGWSSPRKRTFKVARSLRTRLATPDGFSPGTSSPNISMRSLLRVRTRAHQTRIQSQSRCCNADGLPSIFFEAFFVFLLPQPFLPLRERVCPAVCIRCVVCFDWCYHCCLSFCNSCCCYHYTFYRSTNCRSDSPLSDSDRGRFLPTVWNANPIAHNTNTKAGTDTDTDTKTHRQTQTQTQTQTLTQTQTKTQTQAQTQTETQTQAQNTQRHTDTQTHRRTYTKKQTRRHTDTQIDTQTHRHTDTQTHKHTDILKH